MQKTLEDYLKTPEVEEMMYRERKQVLDDSRANPEKYQGRLLAGCGADPEAIEQEINRQQAALTEELAQNLPDEYLSPEELREREERKPPHRWEEE